jgi:broad specificity phosphatase PhoE
VSWPHWTSGQNSSPDLAEWDYGDYEGKLSSEIREARPTGISFVDGCPGGELPKQVSSRSDRLIMHLRALQGTIALFSHGEFGLALAARCVGLPIAEGQHCTLGTASLSILGFNLAHPEIRVITLLNATPLISSAKGRLDQRRRHTAALTRTSPNASVPQGAHCAANACATESLTCCWICRRWSFPRKLSA